MLYKVRGCIQSILKQNQTEYKTAVTKLNANLSITTKANCYTNISKLSYKPTRCKKHTSIENAAGNAEINQLTSQELVIAIIMFQA